MTFTVGEKVEVHPAWSGKEPSIILGSMKLEDLTFYQVWNPNIKHDQWFYEKDVSQWRK